MKVKASKFTLKKDYRTTSFFSILVFRPFIMHLSIMLSPRIGGGGGGADPLEFDFLSKAGIEIPTPRQLMNVSFQPLE